MGYITPNPKVMGIKVRSLPITIRILQYTIDVCGGGGYRTSVYI